MREIKLPTIKITSELTLSESSPTFIVAEIGLCHNGDLDLAKKMIKDFAAAGADAVKFQKRDVDNLAIPEVLDAPDDRFPSFGKTYREVRRRIEFDMEQYRELKEVADDFGVLFFASAFDSKSANQMIDLGCPILKLASHSLTNLPFLRHVASQGIPTFLSTGMAYMEEIDKAVEVFKSANTPLALYHCVSEYPHKHDRTNLKLIEVLRKRYDLLVGYSSHEVENFTTPMAVALGAFSVEKHVTLDRGSEGFDHKLAQDLEGFRQLVRWVRNAEEAMGSGEKTVTRKEQETRDKYHFSLVTQSPISKGTVIEKSMLTTKNPGTGILAKEIDNVIGKKAKVDIPGQVLLTWQHITD